MADTTAIEKTTYETHDVVEKIKANLEYPSDALVNKTEFRKDDRLTLQLRRLRDAVLCDVPLASKLGEVSELYSCDIGDEHFLSKGFAGLYTQTTKFYIREGYAELYSIIHKCWHTTNRCHVMLLGNAGTGKSWFQIYVLKRLLNERNGYDFVMRQIGLRFFLIDLETCCAFELLKLDQEPLHKETAKSYLELMQRTLYFFEPAEEKEEIPQDVVGVPSLFTLSPHPQRIAEHKKGQSVRLYFWPWWFSEIEAVVADSGLLDDVNVEQRYCLFGGIIRHVLGDSMKEKETIVEIETRALNVDLSLLQRKGLNLDRDESGNSVSGFLLCYDDKDRVNNEFHTIQLTYTSAFAEELVEKRLLTKPLEEHMETVLRRLDNQAADLNGVSLEQVGTELLSRGNECKWETTKVGELSWSPLTETKQKKDVHRRCDIFEYLCRENLALVSPNKNFPLVDVVFSTSSATEPISTFQFTWQDSRPFTLRSLLELRMKLLKVAHNRVVIVNIVAPGKEAKYETRQKMDFLKNGAASLDKPFHWSKASKDILLPDALQTIWHSTEIHILRPQLGWKHLVKQWLENRTNTE